MNEPEDFARDMPGLTPEQRSQVKTAMSSLGDEAVRKIQELRARMGEVTTEEAALRLFAFKQIQATAFAVMGAGLCNRAISAKGISRVAELWGSSVAESLILAEQFIVAFRAVEQINPTVGPFDPFERRGG